MGAATSGRRIVILSAAMGGGHLQISRELQRRLHERGHTVDVVDVLDIMPTPTGRLLGASYPWLVNRAPHLYQKVYEVFFLGHQHAGERVGIPVRLMLPGLRRLLRTASPDLVLSTYPLCTVALGHLKAQRDVTCPAVTVVTTFALNNLWVHPSIDLEICISDDAAQDAQRLSGRAAVVSGPIVRPGFTVDQAGSDDHRQSPHTRTALVSTGSLGLAGSAVQAAEAIAGMPGWEAVVLCGRDERLRQQLSARADIRVVGWVEDMPSTMASAEALVDNAGGMTAKEALTMGLPVVTFQPLAGHGREDAHAMARLGITEVVSTTDALRKALRALEDPELRQQRIDRGRALVVEDPVDVIERLCREAPAHSRRPSPGGREARGAELSQ